MTEQEIVERLQEIKENKAEFLSRYPEEIAENAKLDPLKQALDEIQTQLNDATAELEAAIEKEEISFGTKIIKREHPWVDDPIDYVVSVVFLKGQEICSGGYAYENIGHAVLETKRTLKNKRDKKEKKFISYSDSINNYNKIQEEIEKLKNEEDKIKKIKNYPRLTKLQKELKKLYPEFQEAKRIQREIERIEQNITLIEGLEPLAKKQVELSEKELRCRESLYSMMRSLDPQKREEREKTARAFELTQLYVENKEEFENSRKTLVMIYDENLDGDYIKELPKWLKIYDQAEKIAAMEGKNFKAWPSEVQFEYFEAAKIVVEKNIEMGIDPEKD